MMHNNRKISITELSVYLRDNPNCKCLLDPQGKSDRATIIEAKNEWTLSQIVNTFTLKCGWYKEMIDTLPSMKKSKEG